MNVDSRGVRRGRCTVCTCEEYRLTKSLKCETCSHPPAKHRNLELPISSGPGSDILCQARGCKKEAYFQPNVGRFDYCSPECRDRDLLSQRQKKPNP